MKAFKGIMLALVILAGFGAGAFFLLRNQGDAAADAPDAGFQNVQPATEPPPVAAVDPRLDGLKDRGDGARLLWPAETGETLLAAGFADNRMLIIAATSTDPASAYRLFAVDAVARQRTRDLEGPAPRSISAHQPAHQNADKFCYSKRVGGVSDIWCADYAWQNPKQLTRHNGREDLLAPALSPDGGWAAFEVNTDRLRAVDPRAPGSTIWKIGLNGAGLQQLTRGADDRNASWSHDGGLIFFQRRLPDGDWDLYSMNADGSDPEPIMRTYDDDEQWPAPIGDTLKMAMSVGPKGGAARVKILDTVTKASEAITSGRYGSETSVSVSPDGKLVSFIAPLDPADPTRLGVWLKAIE